MEIVYWEDIESYWLGVNKAAAYTLDKKLFEAEQWFPTTISNLEPDDRHARQTARMKEDASSCTHHLQSENPDHLHRRQIMS